MQRATSSLNPGTDEELQASFRRWMAIESVYRAPPVVCKKKWDASTAWCLECDIRPYDGEPLTDRDEQVGFTQTNNPTHPRESAVRAVCGGSASVSAGIASKFRLTLWTWPESQGKT